MLMRERFRVVGSLMIGAVLALVLRGVQAQTIDDVSLLVQGSDVVARVSVNATVRFRQQTPVTPAQLYSISFDVIAADEAVLLQTTSESRRFAASGGVPEFTLTFSPTGSSRVKQLTLQLSSNAAVKVRQGPSTRVIDIVFIGLASQAAAPAVPASERPFAVTLQSVPLTEVDKLLPVPNRFDRFEVFGTNSVVNGVTTFDVNLGYFATREEAETVRKSALERFPQAFVLDLAARRAEVLKSAAAAAPAASVADSPARQAQVTVPAPEAAPAAVTAAAAVPAAPATPVVVAPATPVVVAPSAAAVLPATPSATAAAADQPPLPAATPVEARGADLMSRAREALAARRNEVAIDNLNQLLLLPPNKYSQEAQELIGLAWERAGNQRRARAEYELYLKLFPQGEGSQRVSQRLASLEGVAASPPDAVKPLTEAAAAPRPVDKGPKFTGNIAQYYYGGKSRSQSLVNIAAGIDQSTLTKTTESAIVTSLDLGGRYTTPEAETRVVLRGTGSTNLVSTSHSASQLSAAYIDYKRNENGLAVRLGRQSPISGGLLGLFDGASLSYPFAQGWKVDVMGGVPASPLVSLPSERLLAAVIEADGIAERWGGDVYFLDQSTEGITNRRAIGGEVRYSDELLSMYSLLDYDTQFRKLNATSLQGSFQAPAQTTITVLVDSRKAPSLQLSNALISTGATSLKTLLQLQALDQLRDAALATTAQARQALLSISRPLSEKWQISTDLRYSDIGALPAVGNFEATPATGGQYGATVQLTGSNLYSMRDINNVNVSVLSTPVFKGAQLSYSNLTGLRENDLTIEPSMRLYTQHDNQGVKLYRVTPGVRATYRLSRRASVLGESIVEHSRTDGPTNNDSTNSIFFYFGYRYELF
jgi:tetratricopeptide (TPR) repeat protein